MREEFVVWYMIATRVATLYRVSRITWFAWSNYCTFELQYNDTRATTFVAARSKAAVATESRSCHRPHCRAHSSASHLSIESPAMRLLNHRRAPRCFRERHDNKSPCAPDLRSTDGPKELRRARQNHGCSDSFSFAQRRSSFYNCVGEIFYHYNGENLYHGAADIICGMWFFSSDQLTSTRK